MAFRILRAKWVHALAALAFALPLATIAQTNMSAYLGGNGNDRLEQMLRLSDGTVLVAGSSTDLTWVPTSVVRNQIALGGATLNSADRRGNIGTIMRFTRNLDTLLEVHTLPANTVQDVTKIKTNTVPGAPTGDIFISGRRSGTVGNQGGWYVAKLNNNFIAGAPTALVYAINVGALPRSTNQFAGPWANNGQDPDTKIWQPWDVQSDGKVVLVTGQEFEANWSAFERYKVDGSGRDTVGNWPNHWVRWVTGEGRTGTTEFRGKITDIPRDSVWINTGNNVFDSVAFTEVLYSGIVLKVNRNGSNLRSYTQQDFDLVTTDENKTGTRKGKFADDYFYQFPCVTGNCNSFGPGYTGYNFFNPNNNVATQRVVAVEIDKRNNDLYYGLGSYSQHLKNLGLQWDFEPSVHAMRVNGEQKWWARCYPTDTNSSPAGQVIDALALDYTSNQVIVVGRSIGKGVDNFWKPTQLTHDNRPGVLNELIAANLDENIHTSWIGKYAMDSLRIFRSTYVAERAPNQPLGAPVPNPLYDGWDDLNQGNPNLADTRIQQVVVLANGDIAITAYTQGRTMTTADALQSMMKPDRGGNTDSASAPNAFVRVYSSDLTQIKYSSLLTGIWDPFDGSQGDNVRLQGLLATEDGNGLLVTGYQDTLNGTPLASAGGRIPVLNAPTFARKVPVGREGVFARLNFFGVTPLIPALEGIQGRLTACQGDTGVYRIINPPAGVTFQWAVPSERNWRGFSESDSIKLVGLPGQGGTLRAAARTATGIGPIVGLRLTAPGVTARPTSISVPPTTAPHCRGTVRTYRANGTPGATRYVWYLPNSGWQQDGSGALDSVVTTADSINILIRDTTTRGGVISVRVYGICGPSSLQSNTRPVPVTRPALPIVTVNNTVLTATNTVGVTIQWFRDGSPIAGATSGTYNTQGIAGCYAVRYRNGCDTSITPACLVSLPGANPLAATRVYPNPTAGQLNLDLPTDEALVAEIRDIAGRLHSQTELVVKAGQSQLNIQSLPQGVYHLVLRGRNGSWTTRVVKE